MSTSFYHADGIGSSVASPMSRQCHGRLLLHGLRRAGCHTGTGFQPYAFAGEPYDPNSGFQYHRARWMEPEDGAICRMDP